MQRLKGKKELVIQYIWIGVIFGLVLILGYIYHLYQNDVSTNGKLYSSKEKMCMHFALSYLRSIQKLEPEFGDEKWQIAIDVETDLYNLCMANVDSDSLGRYKFKVLEKYHQRDF